MNRYSVLRIVSAACLIVLLAVWAGLDVGSPPAGRALADDEPPRALGPGDVDTELSRVYVFIGKRRLGHEHGVEGRIQEGEVHLSGNEPGEIVFDMDTFSADTAAAREYVGLEGTTDADEQNDVTNTMQGSKVLHVSEYPTATFDISRIEKFDEQTDDGHDLYTFSGEFTLRGQTNEIEFRAAATEEQDGRLRLQGDFQIKQTDYGIKPYSAFFGAVAVTDEVKIFGDLWVVRE